MIVVIDCNVLLVSIPKKSKYRPIFDAIITGKVSLAVNNEILMEYLEIISNKANLEIATNIVDMILSLPFTIKGEPYFRFNLINADADDNKYVDTAISCNADLLITNDLHFQVLKSIPFPKVNVVSASDFLDSINS
jgi:putative PIN family toxin of toxin-antitoxin system